MTAVPVSGTVPSASAIRTVDVIGGQRLIHDILVRLLSRQSDAFWVRGHQRLEGYANAVPQASMAPVIVPSNLHPEGTGSEVAEKFRREGYRGKIFIFTGGPRPLPTEHVNGVYEKALEHERLIQAIVDSF